MVATCGATLWHDRETTEATTLSRALGRLELVANLTSHELADVGAGGKLRAEHLEAALRRLPGIALTGSRAFYLTDPEGFIVAAGRAPSHPPAHISDLYPTDTGPTAEIELADGTPALVARRDLDHGRITVVQPRAVAMQERSPLNRTLTTIAALGSLGLIVLGIGYARSSSSARKIGQVFDRLRRQLDTSLTQGRCGLWDWNVSRGRIVWSSSLFDLLDLEPRAEEMPIAEVAALMERQDGRALRILIDEAQAAGRRHVERDVRILAADGDWRWLRLRAELVRDAGDGDIHAVGIALDVTEEHGAREARAGQDRRLADAVEALSEAFVLWDADEKLILCNSKWSDLHGVPHELTRPGTTYAAIAAAGLQPIAAPRLTRGAIGGAGSRTTETQLADGRWLHVSERPTRDGGVVSVGTDVSDLKANEARLAEAEQRLKRSVRAAEIKAQRLAVIAERNLEANLAKTEFLARVSHELRTPLTAIIGFADMMRQEMLGPLGARRYAEYSRDIHRSGLKLLDVIDGILQMSRLESGAVRLSPALLSLTDVAQCAVGCVAGEIELKHIGLEIDALEPALIHADERALHEVLVQVLRNATRFAPEDGRIRIRIRPAAGRMNVFIEDNGPGIAPEIVPQLGRPFVQAEAEYSRSGGSTGLGLAIARSLAELHGGRLRIRSQIGEGTIVLVNLPLVQVAANDALTDASQGEPDYQPRLQLVAAE